MQSIVVKFSVVFHELTPSRCRTRNCCHGFYFEPATFDDTATPVDAVFIDPECPEKGDAEGVDDV